MKYLLCGVAAVAVLSGCGKSTEPADAPLDEVTLRDGDPAEADAVLSAMLLSNSGDGAITYSEKTMDGATATFSDVAIGDGEEGISAGSLVLEGLDMIDGKASFAKMSLSDISLQADDLEDGSFTVGSFEILNPTPELSAWIADAMDGEEPESFPAAGDIGFAAWSIKDVAMSFSDSDGDGSLSLANFEVRDLADQKAARAVLSDMDFAFTSAEDGTPVNMSLGSLSMSGLDLEFLEAVRQNIDDEEAMAEAIMNKVYDNPMDPGYDRLTMDSLSVEAAGATFKMPSLDASIERNSEGEPVKYVTKPFSMTLDADPDGGEAGAGLAQALSMVGYESVELKGEGEASYDPDQDIVELSAKKNYIELIDGAKISYGAKLAGYSAYSQAAAESFNFEDLAEGEEPDPMAMQAALSELELYDFELSVKDNSLVDRIFNAVATQNGQDPEQMRQQTAAMVGMAPMMAQESGIDMTIVTELSSAVSSFITDPGTLTIKLSPEEPLSMATISTMEDPSLLTKDYLGFSATAD